MVLGFGVVMALSVMYLLSKYGDLSSEPQHPCKKPVDECVSLPIMQLYGDRDEIHELSIWTSQIDVLRIQRETVCICIWEGTHVDLYMCLES